MIIHIVSFAGGVVLTVSVILFSWLVSGIRPSTSFLWRARLEKQWMEREIMPAPIFEVMFAGMQAAKKATDDTLMLACLWHGIGRRYRLEYDQLQRVLKLAAWWSSCLEISRRCRLELATRERTIEMEQENLDQAV